MTKKRIMIVEDEPMTLMNEERMVRNLGYQVVDTALSGEVAVQRAGVIKPDLVLMDIKLMGDMDGREAALEIQKLHKIPVVFITAYGVKETSASENLTAPEGVGYIVKPFTEEELGSEIKRLIG
ncbi:MAG: response regulator [Rhodospirillales bacterium]